MESKEEITKQEEQPENAGISGKAEEIMNLLTTISQNPDKKIDKKSDQNLRKFMNQYKKDRTKQVQFQILGKRIGTLFPKKLEGSSMSTFKFDFDSEKKTLSPKIFKKYRPLPDRYKKTKPQNSEVHPSSQQTPKEQMTQIEKSFDNYLELVSNFYYGNNQNNGIKGEGENGVKKILNKQPSQVKRHHLTTLDKLVSPIRTNLVFEMWSPYEIALFEAGICKFGKNFHSVGEFIHTKTVNEIVEFYYVWKKTGHYKVWKNKMEAQRDHDQNQWIFIN